MENLIELTTKAHELHEKFKHLWTKSGRLSDEKYRADVFVLNECVLREQEIEPIRSRVIQKHYQEIIEYDSFKESFKTGNAFNSVRKYLNFFSDIEMLYELQEEENKRLEKLKRDASYLSTPLFVS